MLDLVVGGAPAVKPVAFLGQPEGMQALAPAGCLAVADITMPVDQDRRQARVLDPRPDEKGRAVRQRILEDLAVKTDRLQHRQDVILKIRGKILRPALRLADRRTRDKLREIGNKAATGRIIGSVL